MAPLRFGKRRTGPQDLRDPAARAMDRSRTGVPVNLGPERFKPSQPQGVGGSASRRVSLPGETFPAAGSIPVDVIGEADIAAAATATLVTIRVPDTYTFRVSGIGFGAEDESGLRFLSWTLFANPPQGPIYGYVNMPAAIGSIAQPRPIFIVLGSSVILTLVATNNGPVGSTYHYFASVVGWHFSEKEAS